MKANPFLYSLKIWLTSVALAPLMFLVVEASMFGKSYRTIETFFDQQIETYAICVVFGGIFSIITWLLFFLLIATITSNFPVNRWMKYIIASIGVVLTFGTFAVFFPVFDVYNEFFYLMVSNCICIAAGSLYYQLHAPEEHDDLQLDM
ncbi:hypothetical protein ACFQZI_01320 [Mucilaginibacter lutimaris]|uniref:Uncharacterized protein n=1 Tax=Mucilaginibacter lutimaris TaxID=931629 RepID=A0ABW2ZBM3_9SPHI